jgi:hypothetical protein
MILIMCVGFKMFLGGRGGKEELGVIRNGGKVWGLFMGGWLGKGGEQDREVLNDFLWILLEVFNTSKTGL